MHEIVFTCKILKYLLLKSTKNIMRFAKTGLTTSDKIEQCVIIIYAKPLEFSLRNLIQKVIKQINLK